VLVLRPRRTSDFPLSTDYSTTTDARHGPPVGRSSESLLGSVRLVYEK
jgi:hypothetical protein